MILSHWLTGTLLFLTAVAHADNGLLDFPPTDDGREVLAVDLHTHSVFSDGFVWPSLRVNEAEREGIVALAITEHLEWQPHLQDIPHPDRNRAYEIAAAEAQKGTVQVINGAEITRGPGIGHINAIFIQDANGLLIPNKPSASTGKDLEARFQGDSEALQQEAQAALRKARSQGAFLFLNHPSWVGQRPDGRGRLSPFQQQLITERLIDGVEVGNGGHYSMDAFEMALAHDLAILGTSDIHRLTAWDYADENDHLVPGSKGARTVTLVLSNDSNLAAIRGALDARHTVALINNQLFGREPELRPLVEGALDFSLGETLESYAGESSVYRLYIHNRAPIPLQLRNGSGRVFADNTNVFTVPPRGMTELRLAELSDPQALTELKLQVLNAFTAPDVPLQVNIRRVTNEARQ